jgi:plasmid stabilization system protein ParE
MNKLHYSPESLIDLDEIWTYIFEELQNPTAAQKTLDGILDTIKKLKEFSEMGPELFSVTDVENGYRFLVCGNYLVFYRVNGVEVNIDRILYGRRDYLRILFGNLSEEATK